MNNRRIWKKENQKKLIEERRLQGSYNRALNTVLQDFSVKSVPTAGKIETVLMNKVARTAVAVHKKSLINGLQQVEEAFGNKLPVLEKCGVLYIQKIGPADLAALGLETDIRLARSVGMVNVKTISKNYHDDLRRKHAQMLEIGASTGDMAKAFGETVGALKDKNLSRAKTIAKTETTRIYSEGSLKAYKKSQVTNGKEWVTNISGNPRKPPDSQFNHSRAHGEVVPVDGSFVKTGESLMHPGDPNGSAGNIIRCECSIKPSIKLPKTTPVKPSDVVPDATGLPQVGYNENIKFTPAKNVDDATKRLHNLTVDPPEGALFKREVVRPFLLPENAEEI